MATNNSNFATWNINARGTNMSQGTFSNGNLTYAASGDDGYFTTAKLSHKCYCELRVDSLGNYGGTLGIVSNMARKNYDSVTFQFNYQSGVIYHYKDGSQQSNRGNIGGTVSSGSILMMAYDPDSFKGPLNFPIPLFGEISNNLTNNNNSQMGTIRSTQC